MKKEKINYPFHLSSQICWQRIQQIIISVLKIFMCFEYFCFFNSLLNICALALSSGLNSSVRFIALFKAEAFGFIYHFNLSSIYYINF